MRPSSSRRTLLRGLLAGGVASALGAPLTRAARTDHSAPPVLKRQHFVFDYYPWYSAGPDFRHWDQWDRRPPHDLASNYLPALGAYDSHRVLEHHARWILESGARAVALSWWGPGSYEDRLVDRVMDVFGAHGIAVGFGLEPYRDDRGLVFADDVEYLIRRYGERRRFDAFHLHADEDDTVGPVFKGFRCIVPRKVIDCRGRSLTVPDHTSDENWRVQLDRVRETFRGSFDRVRFLADSLDFGRTPAAGFDGIAVYDNFVAPDRYRPLAEAASAAGLLFSFGVNPGYDQIEPRKDPPPEPGAPDNACYAPRPVAPDGARVDYSDEERREEAARACAERIR